MSRPAIWLALGAAALLGAIGWLVRETFVLAAMVGDAELRARQATTAAPGVDAVEYAQLRLDLKLATERLAAVEALLEQRQREAAALAAAAAASAPPPMAEGVRRCVLALQGELRAQGFLGPRFLRADRLVDGALEGVEILDADPEGIDVAFVHAARMTATLDRARGRLELRFVDGLRSSGGERQPLPVDGFVLAYGGVDGPALEAALPALVRAEGVYPEPRAATRRPGTDVDPLVRGQWLERLDLLLSRSGTAPEWRIQRFRGMQDGWFLTVELIGVDERRHVVAGAHCERAAIEIDEAAGVVSLLLRSGVLRRGGIESTISAEGFRMLLPNLTPAAARDAMFGMVVAR
jgi:hypothetical protein